MGLSARSRSSFVAVYLAFGQYLVVLFLSFLQIFLSAKQYNRYIAFIIDELY
jgi:hypothetical protein